MYEAIIIVALSGNPGCDGWFERFFFIECATVARRVHRPDPGRSSPGSGRNGEGDLDGDGRRGDGDVGAPDGGESPPAGGGGTPPAGDADRGHGNDHGRHDPDNPGKGKGRNR